MPEAARDQFRPLLEPAELAPGKAMQVGDGVGQGVFHGALDTSIARLLGIELRGVGRQVGHREVPRVRGEEGGCPAPRTLGCTASAVISSDPTGTASCSVVRTNSVGSMNP